MVKVLSVLLLLNGVFVACIGAWLAWMCWNAYREHEQDENEASMTFFLVLFGVCATAGLVISLLHIVSGIKCFRFRGRQLAIAALATDTILLFYLPFGIPAGALMVYGLRILTSRQAIDAFDQMEASVDDHADDDYFRVRRMPPAVGDDND
jgi:hypothetical protein